MPEQHTFKTTRDTAWLDEVLNAYPKGKKSDVIRELVLIGLAVKGINPPSPLDQYQNVPQKVTPVSQNVPQKVTPAPESNTTKPLTLVSTMNIEDAPEIVAVEMSVDDLESRLNSMNFD